MRDGGFAEWACPVSGVRRGKYRVAAARAIWEPTQFDLTPRRKQGSEWHRRRPSQC